MATNVKRKKKAEVMPDDGNMTLTGHLKELRNRLIVCAVVFVAAVVVTLAYADRLIDDLDDLDDLADADCPDFSEDTLRTVRIDGRPISAYCF